MSDFWEIWAPLLLVCAGMPIVFVVAFVGVNYLDCRGFQSGTGIPTKWEWGCYAQVDGRWVPKDYAFGDAHELRHKKQ